MNLASKIGIALLPISVALVDAGLEHIRLQGTVDEGITLCGKLLLNVDEIISTTETDRLADFKFVADLNDATSDCREEAISFVAKDSDVSVITSTPAWSATIVFVVPCDGESLDVILHCWLTFVEEFIVAHVKSNSLDTSQKVP